MSDDTFQDTQDKDVSRNSMWHQWRWVFLAVGIVILLIVISLASRVLSSGEKIRALESKLTAAQAAVTETQKDLAAVDQDLAKLELLRSSLETKEVIATWGERKGELQAKRFLLGQKLQVQQLEIPPLEDRLRLLRGTR